MRTGRPTKNILLKDRDFLYEKYVVEKLSTVELSKLLNCNAGSIHYSLRKFGITTRNLSESHLTSDGTVYIDNDKFIGSMLGDASILRRNRQTLQSLAYYSKTNINYDHIVYANNYFYSDRTVESRIEEFINNSGNQCFRYTTLSSYTIDELHKKWYIDYIKIVPKDFIMTPGILLNWFMDDGTTVFKKGRNGKFDLLLCSESFTQSDNEFLIELLKEVDIEAVLAYNGKGYGHRLRIRQKSICNFFDYIGDCPIESMKYKWKLKKKEDLQCQF